MTSDGALPRGLGEYPLYAIWRSEIGPRGGRKPSQLVENATSGRRAFRRAREISSAAGSTAEVEVVGLTLVAGVGYVLAMYRGGELRSGAELS